MRIIFVDFDGVLNADTDEPDESEELWTASWLDTAMVGRLARLVETTGARVVISSSWRQRRSRAELQAILAERGYSGGVLDVTPRHQRSPDGERFVRSGEISAWLDAHPEVSAFVILDDDEEFGPLGSKHVRVDARVGLTHADVLRAQSLLDAVTE